MLCQQLLLLLMLDTSQASMCPESMCINHETACEMRSRQEVNGSAPFRHSSWHPRCCAGYGFCISLSVMRLVIVTRMLDHCQRACAKMVDDCRSVMSRSLSRPIPQPAKRQLQSELPLTMRLGSTLKVLAKGVFECQESHSAPCQ